MSITSTLDLCSFCGGSGWLPDDDGFVSVRCACNPLPKADREFEDLVGRVLDRLDARNVHQWARDLAKEIVEPHPLETAIQEDILRMVFNPEMEHASIGSIWETLRRKYGALLPARCIGYYWPNTPGQPPR